MGVCTWIAPFTIWLISNGLLSVRTRTIKHDLLWARVDPWCSASGTKVECGGDGTLTVTVVRGSGHYTRYTEGIVQEGITSLGRECFYTCAAMTKITLPDSLVETQHDSMATTGLRRCLFGPNVRTINSRTFNCVRTLKFIEVSPSNTYFSNDDQGVLYNFDKSTVVIVPGGLTSVTLPDTVTCLRANSIRWTCLTELTVPDSVTEIGDEVFWSSPLTHLHIGSGIRTFASTALKNVVTLQEITVKPGGNLYSDADGFGHYDIASNKKTSILFIPPGTTSVRISKDIRDLGPTVFQCSPNLTYVECEAGSSYTTPDNQIVVQSTANGATVTVLRCVGAAHTVVLQPSWGITTIGVSAFMTSNIVSITLCSTVKYIHTSACRECHYLTHFDFNGATPTTIPADAFVSSRSLPRITLPPSVKIIMSGAFGSTPIQEINLDYVEDIGTNAFSGCKSLLKVNLGSAWRINASAFSGCSKLAEIDFGTDNKIEILDSSSFTNCVALTSVNLPGSVSYITATIFGYDSSLTEINVLPFSRSAYTSFRGIPYTADGRTIVACPPGLRNISLELSTEIIGKYSFYGCTKLVEVKMNSQVHTIEENAFFDCPRIERIQLPAAVNFIGASAFDSCAKLNYILYCNYTDCDVWEGDPFPTNPDIYVFLTFKGDTFCNHYCNKWLDDWCNLPTEYFTQPDQMKQFSVCHIWPEVVAPFLLLV